MTATSDPRGAAGRLADSLGLTDGDLVALYRRIVLARAIDERMWVLNRSGRVAFVISGQGHEGAQAGIVSALRPGHDWLVPYYRSVASVLTFGMTPREIMLAQFAKAPDPSSGGRQMPGHYGGAAHNIYTTSSPTGTQVLHATGLALAAKLRRTGQVALVELGEGAANQGEVHEALNFAGIHRLPLVVVVENNGYAISVPAAKQSAVADFASRAAGYGMPGLVVDGADVLGCHRAGREAVDRARRDEGPTFIEAKVTRLTPHSSDDQQTRYRSAEELELEKLRDPLPCYREQLLEAGILTQELVSRIAAEAAEEVEDATDWAEQQPDPSVESAMRFVYAEERH